METFQVSRSVSFFSITLYLSAEVGLLSRCAGPERPLTGPSSRDPTRARCERSTGRASQPRGPGLLRQAAH